jgi:uncharacterized protein (TIGR02147 family)
MNLFKSNTYLEYLKAVISENRRQKGYRSELAKAANCHRTHISLVLSGRNQLTLEQACGIADYWKLGALEQQYFLSLVELARAGTTALRNVLKARLEKLKIEREDLAVRFEAAKLEDPVLARDYYLSWEVSAIHLLIAVKQMAKTTELAKRLNLSEETVESALKQLKKMGLVSEEGDHWKVTVQRLHAPKGSVPEVLHQINWRNQAIQRIPRNVTGELHYTSLYTLSKKDVEVLREKIVDFIEVTRAIVHPSAEEEIVCFTCDYFRV